MAMVASKTYVNNGRLVQIGDSFRAKRSGDRQAVFSCACGIKVITNIYAVKSGRALSCGCLHKEIVAETMRIHGHSSGGKVSRIYNAWNHMIRRCSDAATGEERKNYFSRGIRVCDRWMAFENFIEDMGEMPLGMTLDRINNNAGYCKENCRWATQSTQMRNTRRTIMVPVNGVLMCAKDAAAAVGMNRETLCSRIRKGMSPEEAICKPLRGR